MQKISVIIALMIAFSLYVGTVNAYNVRQKEEAEAEYKHLNELCENIEEAIENLDKRREVVKYDDSRIDDCTLTFYSSGLEWTTGSGTTTSIKVEIDGEVTDLIRDELKILLKKHLNVLERKRNAINVK